MSDCELNYTNISRGYFPDLAAIRKAVQWGGLWATVEDNKNTIYSVGVSTNGDFNNFQPFVDKPVTLLCLADSRGVNHLEVFWPPEVKDLNF